jgi:hypothetical protein
MTNQENYQPVLDRYQSLDVRPLAALIAKELGGTMLPDRGDEPCTWYSEFAMPDGAVVTLYRNNQRFRVSVGLDNETRRKIGNTVSLPKMVDATFAPNRPIATLAKEIARRVIEPNQAALSVARERVAEELGRRSTLADTVATLRKQFPIASIDLSREGDSATFYLNARDIYLNGSLYADGSLSVQRCGRIPADRLAAVLNAMLGEA